MSLTDRDCGKAPRPGRVTRMDGGPVDGVVLEAEPVRSSRFSAPCRRRSPLRLLLIGAAALGAFTGVWTVGCGVVEGSLHTDGGTFVPPANNLRKQGE